MGMKAGSIVQIKLDTFTDLNSELMGRFKVVDVDGSRGLYLMQLVDSWQQPIDPPFEEPADESSSQES